MVLTKLDIIESAVLATMVFAGCSPTAVFADGDSAFVHPVFSVAYTSVASQTAGAENARRTPVISRIAPSTIAYGQSGFTLDVEGANLTQDVTVSILNQPLKVTAIGNSHRWMTCYVPTSLSSKLAGAVYVSVSRSGQAFAKLPLLIRSPKPIITSLLPSTMLAYSGQYRVEIDGAGFAPSDKITTDAGSVVSTFVSANQINAIVDLGYETKPGTYNVAITNAQGLVSQTTIKVTDGPYPIPTAFSIPTTVTVFPEHDVTIAAIGTGFLGNTTVEFNGKVYPSKAEGNVNTNAVLFTIPKSVITSAGTFPVKFVNPAPGGGVTASSITIAPLLTDRPEIRSIKPDTLPAGSAGTVTVGGVNFNPNSAIRINGDELPTTFVSNTELVTKIDPTRYAAGLRGVVTVANSAISGGVSDACSFDIVPPTPVVVSVTPSELSIGQFPDTVVITGSGFTPCSYVKTQEGGYFHQTYVSPTEIDLDLNHSWAGIDPNKASDYNLAVINESLGFPIHESNTAPLRVCGLQPHLTGVSTPTIYAGMVQDVILKGSGFLPCCQADTSATRWKSPNEITASVDLRQARPGTYDLYVAQQGLISETVTVQVVSPSRTASRLGR